MKNIIFGLFLLALTASTAFCESINTVLVTTNHLDIPYTGTYATNRLVKLGNYSLSWHQAGKSADIIATLPTNIPSGTYTLTLQGSSPVSVEIGSVTAEANLANQINVVSNSLAASFNAQLNAASNNIVTSLTKNFATAYAFGYQVISNTAPIVFSSFIGDWTTNGTTFKIPKNGVYQINCAIYGIGPKTSFPAVDPSVQLVAINNNITNVLANLPVTGGGTAAQCFQDDEISIMVFNPNSGGIFCYGFNIGNDFDITNTNVPTATLSIIQIQ
jgi:hypothetical protein